MAATPCYSVRTVNQERITTMTLATHFNTIWELDSWEQTKLIKFLQNEYVEEWESAFNQMATDLLYDAIDYSLPDGFCLGYGDSFEVECVVKEQNETIARMCKELSEEVQSRLQEARKNPSFCLCVANLLLSNLGLALIKKDSSYASTLVMQLCPSIVIAELCNLVY